MKNENDCVHVSSPGVVCLSIHLPTRLSVHACMHFGVGELSVKNLMLCNFVVYQMN